MAATTRRVAAARPGGRSRGSARRAKAQAAFRRGMPKTGTPHPSTPTAHVGGGHAGQGGHGGQDALLHRMAGPEVALRGDAQVLARASMPACLPEQLLCSAWGWPAASSRWAVGWCSGACRPQARPADPAPACAGCRPRRRVEFLAVVGGSDDREFAVGQAEGVGGAALHQRDGLHGLGRRAQVGHEVRVAARVEQVARRIHYSQRAEMAGLHQRAASHFDESLKVHSHSW